MKRYLFFLLTLVSTLLQADDQFGTDFVRRYGANSPIMSATADYFKCKPKERIAHMRTHGANRRHRRTENRAHPETTRTRAERRAKERKMEKVENEIVRS
jgi:hypothetical protein